MYAIIEESGRQFKVTGGDTILIDRDAPEGDKTITFDRVLLVGGAGGDTKIGAPLVAGATVTAEVLGEAKGPKIDIFKYKRRKGYRRRKGHRQQYLKVRITDINV
jgi:large subunit ribosomal protein L21